MLGKAIRTVTTDNGSEVDAYDTYDEALAAVLAGTDPGCIAVIHEETCRMCADEFEGAAGVCTCEPLEFIVGVQA